MTAGADPRWPEPDERLRAALRHAPDAGERPPPALDAAILRAARQAVAPRPAWRRLLDRLAAELARPAGRAALASVLMAGFITLLWRGSPPPEALSPPLAQREAPSTARPGAVSGQAGPERDRAASLPEAADDAARASTGADRSSTGSAGVEPAREAASRARQDAARRAQVETQARQAEARAADQAERLAAKRAAEYAQAREEAPRALREAAPPPHATAPGPAAAARGPVLAPPPPPPPPPPPRTASPSLAEQQAPAAPPRPSAIGQAPAAAVPGPAAAPPAADPGPPANGSSAAFADVIARLRAESVPDDDLARWQAAARGHWQRLPPDRTVSGAADADPVTNAASNAAHGADAGWLRSPGGQPLGRLVRDADGLVWQAAGDGARWRWRLPPDQALAWERSLLATVGPR